jgi:hypothetical protein
VGEGTNAQSNIENDKRKLKLCYSITECKLDDLETLTGHSENYLKQDTRIIRPDNVTR